MSQKNNPEHSLPYHIRSAFRGFETALARYLVKIDLPLSYFYILRLQWQDEGHQQNEIAEKACMTESVASQVIQKMEKDGLVIRKTDANDGRKRRVFLTEKGGILREKVMIDGIKISKSHAPNICAQDIKTTIAVLMAVKEAFDVYNESNNS